jgi:hypothetical protein
MYLNLSWESVAEQILEINMLKLGDASEGHFTGPVCEHYAKVANKAGLAYWR